MATRRRALRGFRPATDRLESVSLVSSLVPALPGPGADAGVVERRIPPRDPRHTIRAAAPRASDAVGPAPVADRAVRPVGRVEVAARVARSGLLRRPPRHSPADPGRGAIPQTIATSQPTPSRARPAFAPWTGSSPGFKASSTRPLAGPATTPTATGDAPATADSSGTVSIRGSKGGKAGYQSFLVGDPTDVAARNLRGGLVLQGGSYDFVAPFVWMRDVGGAGGGDFVVIRATGTDAYNPYIYGDVGGFNSVETLIVSTRYGANDPVVAAKVRGAEAVWIAGGDQADYVQLWTGTALADAVNYVANVKLAPVGGTSAGLSVMGEFVFGAREGTVDSATALGNPYNRKVDLTERVFSSGAGQANLPYLDDVITDSHFAARDRMGRLVAFLARLNNPAGLDAGLDPPARGIGVSEQTALVVDRNGIGTVLAGADPGNPAPADPHVYIVTPPGPAEVAAAKTPLTYRDLAVHRMGPGDTFDLATWQARSGGQDYVIAADAGALGVLTPGVGSVYG